jgi:hypothetical protein
MGRQQPVDDWFSIDPEYVEHLVYRFHRLNGRYRPHLPAERVVPHAGFAVHPSKKFRGAFDVLDSDVQVLTLTVRAEHPRCDGRRYFGELDADVLCLY